MPLTGACRCRAVAYTLEYPAPPVSYACHCLECQTMSGGPCAVQLAIPEARLSIRGAVVSWVVPSPRGGATDQRFCAVCRTRIFSTNTGRPGMALVRGGTLDDSHLLEPALHIWTRRKQPWITLPDEVPSFPEAPPAEIFRSLLGPNFLPPPSPP